MSDDELSDVWRRVMRHLPQLRRIARAMSSCDPRLSHEDILNDALADIVEAEPRLYDAERGTWLSWARTRVWKVRTYHIRALKTHGAHDRVPVGTPKDENDPSIELASGIGSAGHAARTEAEVTLAEVLARATDDELDAALAHLSGFGLERPVKDRKRAERDPEYREKVKSIDRAVLRRQAEVEELIADLGTKASGYGIR